MYADSTWPQTDRSTKIQVIIDQYLELLCKNQMDKLYKKLWFTVEDVLEALKVIKLLNPKLGNSFYTGVTLSYIIPDITVVKLSGYYEIFLYEYMYHKSLHKYFL